MSRFRLVVENFLTPEECVNYITMSEKMGYAEALIQTKGNGEVMNKDVRDNDRVIWDDVNLASELFERMKHLPPQTIDEWQIYGLNERFRFYRYKDGQKFRTHVDGAFKRNENELSLISMLLYLNGDFEGGGTPLLTIDEVIQPKEGMLLLFDHKILHAGLPVTSGTKYV